MYGWEFIQNALGRNRESSLPRLSLFWGAETSDEIDDLRCLWCLIDAGN